MRNSQGQFTSAVALDEKTQPSVVSVIKPDGSAHVVGDYKFTIGINGKPLKNKNSDTPQGYYTQDAAVKSAQHLAKAWKRTLQVMPYPSN